MGIAQQVIVTDDASYTTPAAGAMLDVKSTSKGFMPPRVALTSLTDGSTVATPANGLIIYNTATAGTAPNNVVPGLYNWNGTIWVKELTGGTTGANSLAISDNGFVTLNGSATTWTDMVVPVTAVKLGSTNSPTFVVMKNNGTSRGVWTFTFGDFGSGSEQEVFFSIQMPHNWKEGSTIYPHVHWSPQSAVAGSVVWGFEYSMVNYNQAAPIIFPTTTLVTTTTAAVTVTDIDKHFIAAFTAITPSATQDKISSIIMCRLWRNSANNLDTYDGGNAALLSFDIHYEIDSFGSNDQYVK